MNSILPNPHQPPFATPDEYTELLTSKIEAQTTLSFLSEQKREFSTQEWAKVPEGFYERQYRQILDKKSKTGYPQITFPTLTRLAPAALGLMLVIGFGLNTSNFSLSDTGINTPTSFTDIEQNSLDSYTEATSSIDDLDLYQTETFADDEN